MRRALNVTLVAVLFSVQGVTAARWLFAYQYADDDAGHAVIVARDCLERGHCDARGPGTTLVPLHHGATWIRLIAHSLATGGTLRSVQLIVLCCLVASGALVFLIIRRYVSPDAALLSLVFYLPPTVAAADFNTFVNSNLLPLPVALYYAALALCVESGGTLAAAAAGACLAAAVSANLSCILLLPFHVALVSIVARRSFAAVVASCLALAALFTLESPGSAGELGAFLIVPAVVLLCFTVGALVVRAVFPNRVAIVIERLRSRMQQLHMRVSLVPVPHRMRAVMRAAAIYVSVTVWAACVLASYGLPPPPRLLSPLVIPLVFLAMDSAAALSRRAMTALLVIGGLGTACFSSGPLGLGLWGAFLSAFSGLIAICWVLRRHGSLLGRDAGLPPGPILARVIALVAVAASVLNMTAPFDSQAMPVAVAETIVKRLYASGSTFPELFASMQLPWFGKQMPLMAAFDPDLFGAPQFAVDSGGSLTALMVKEAVASHTEGIIVSVPMNRASSAIAVRAPSYLDRMDLQICAPVPCGEPVLPERCTQRALDRPLRHEWPFIDTPTLQPQGQCIVFLVPLHTFGSHVTHIVRVLDQSSWHLRIRQVSGVDIEGEMGPAEVRLRDVREATGRMEIEAEPSQFLAAGFFFGEPPLIEVTAPNEQLLEPFRTSRLGVW